MAHTQEGWCCGLGPGHLPLRRNLAWCGEGHWARAGRGRGQNGGFPGTTGTLSSFISTSTPWSRKGRPPHLADEEPGVRGAQETCFVQSCRARGRGELRFKCNSRGPYSWISAFSMVWTRACPTLRLGFSIFKIIVFLSGS